ncbi:hypothetical protein FQN54_008122 [Arachnomyces sp. PD_36]|nr:hypothetical protein FQN54_008122 [Arachnomyces sp. PD_36]
MAQSSYQGDFFQTTSSLEETQRKAEKSSNTNGSPIKLRSKILAIAADPADSGSVYVAESAGNLRRVVLETGKSAALYKGPTAPVTSICFNPSGTQVFAGCWDKSIWSWDVATKEVKKRYEGHTDFVKTVICERIGDRDLLISGCADAEIIIWDVQDGRRLEVLKGHTMGILDLAVDPLLQDDQSSRATLFSASSDRLIKRYDIPSGADAEGEAGPIKAHETSVCRLYFDADGDLWTASADKTVKSLSRANAWKPDLELTHPDFVRDVAVHEQGGWVVSACRDEEVRVWNRATGELYHTYSGHFEEVTGLILCGNTIVSVSIDATIRQWSLHPDELQRAKVEAENPAPKGEPEPEAENLLTEEEERELAELMGDD